MKTSLKINDTTCIRCGRCVAVCLSLIFTQKSSREAVNIRNVETCISCGHCAAVCPNGSIQHSLFPAKTVHKIEKTLMPSPEQVMTLCKARRSNRALTSKPIPSEKLELILEAAHRAPTASNLQQVEFTLVTDPEKLRQITNITLDIFTSVISKLENPLLRPILKRMMPDAYRYLPTFHRLIEEQTKGNDLILRGATAAIFIHTPKSIKFGRQDANLAYQNGSLMAESLGISQFYTGFVCAAIEHDKKNRLMTLLGVNGTIHAAMALGIPAFSFPSYIDKKPIQVTRL